MLIRPQRGSYIIEQVVRIKVRSSACWFRFDVWRFARLSFGLFGRLLSKITKWRNNRQQKVKVKYIAGASISHDTGVKSDCCLITVTQSNPIPPQAPWNGVKHPASVKKSSFIIRHMPYVFSVTHFYCMLIKGHFQGESDNDAHPAGNMWQMPWSQN